MALESARGDPLAGLVFLIRARQRTGTFRVALRQEQAAEVVAENAKRLKRGGDLLRKTSKRSAYLADGEAM